MIHYKIISESDLQAVIQKELTGVHPSVCINVLERLCKKYRRENSKRICSQPFGKVDPERPDLLTMKK